MSETVRIGLLDDLCDAAPSPNDVAWWVERAIGAVRDAGRLDARVELVPAYGLGLPAGSADAVERAYAELDAAGVVLIVGPAVGDNALIATPLAEAARLPTLNWSGAERARGDWMFHLQVGSHEDESVVIARHLAAGHSRRIAVAYDISPIGERHLQFLRGEAGLLGLEIVAEAGLSPTAAVADAEIRALLRGDPGAFVYLGLGMSAPAVAAALERLRWSGPRIMSTAGIRGYHGEFADRIDGWAYIDMVADDNRTLAALRDELALPAARTFPAAKGHDLGLLVAEALARAPAFTRDGLRAGLERIKWLPAAEGREGTLLGFGIQDRGALHGRYLVVRQWRGRESIQLD